MGATPTNLLFIIADMFRADCLGCTGNPVIRTPNLDRLAAAGTAFTHCFVQTAPCGPSRSCIYTGRYLCSTRSLHNRTPLADAEQNFGYALREAGFRPALIGYNDYAVDPSILPAGDPRTRSPSYDNILPGFDCPYFHPSDSPDYFRWLRDRGYSESLLNPQAIHRPAVPPEGPGPHVDAHFPAQYRREHSEGRYLTERAIEFLRCERHSHGQSAARGSAAGWVLSLNYVKPHPPYVCADPYHRRYDPASVPSAVQRLDELRPRHRYLRMLRAAQPPMERELSTDAQRLAELRAAYYGMVSELDENLGVLFDALQGAGEWERTFIVFTSDHGHCLGDHYLHGAEHFYDGAMRVPLIVRDPSPRADATRGALLDALVESIDVAPTMLAALGVEPPDRYAGRSLLGLLHGDPRYRLREHVHFEYDYRPTAVRRDPDADPDEHLYWVLRGRDYKYIQFADPDMPPILFDLRVDPDELDDVACRPHYAPRITAACQTLLRWRMVNEDQRMARWALKDG